MNINLGCLAPFYEEMIRKGSIMEKQAPIKIGILNIMHDKADTKKRFDQVLTASADNIELHYFYPKDHYKNRPVPDAVSALAKPLELEQVAKLDAFIITGAPIEKVAFEEVTYIEELHRLFDFLASHQLSQLYVCWGAMAAANYFYEIKKQLLPQKLFGIYPQVIENDSPLLTGLSAGFLAPHARYAELDVEQIRKHQDLKIIAHTPNDELFAMENNTGVQTFLFSHLEYEREALLKEYQRELAAYPADAKTLARPQNYFQDINTLTGPTFKWELAQKVFFENWLQTVGRKREKQLVISR